MPKDLAVIKSTTVSVQLVPGINSHNMKLAAIKAGKNYATKKH